MGFSDGFAWVLTAALCLFSAWIAVYWIGGSGRQSQTRWGWRALSAPCVWVFEGQQLIDASAHAERRLSDTAGSRRWSALHAILSPRFPDFPESDTDLEGDGPNVIEAEEADDPARVLIERIDGAIRVELVEGGPPAETQEILAVKNRRLRTLQNAIDLNPYPVWRMSTEGKVIWTNPAYDRLSASLGHDPSHASEAIFCIFPGDHIAKKTRRLFVCSHGAETKLWFDVTVAVDDDGYLCHAVDVNALVDAEIAQRNFVQTLAKTFAQLSTGLAIFDRNRQLALFNPALIDLTSLPAEFLSSRPNLLTFFDRLRDQRMMPEPKNYQTWRQQISDLIAAAADGRYHETWSLPSGSVYSVSGRPHPDGAIAFLIEDITAEVTLTRRFRSDLELNQAILDHVEDAIAVFSADGTLALTNEAYRELWAVDPESSFAQVTIVDATRSWQDKCRPTPLWGEIRDFVGTREERADWWSDVTLSGGEHVICIVQPIQKGATMITFRLETADSSVKALPRPRVTA